MIPHFSSFYPCHLLAVDGPLTVGAVVLFGIAVAVVTPAATV
jgi:hypothetical protein